MKRVLFIDRDGTIIKEPADEQIDSFEKLEFVPGVIGALRQIVRKTDYDLVLVSNQDGLGTPSFPEDTFWPVHKFIINTLKGEGIVFKAEHIDCTFPHDNMPTRKPGTAMLTSYMNGDYDIANSFVIGDRETDRQLAVNLGAQPLIIGDEMDWNRIQQIVIGGIRKAKLHRKTTETDITIEINLDGTGESDINTGIGFFDHMLEQIARHGMVDLTVKADGDTNVDEHHTIEDVAIVLGQALEKALGDKRGISRYGWSRQNDGRTNVEAACVPESATSICLSRPWAAQAASMLKRQVAGRACLPMDDCLCQVALDLGGRPWIVWNAEFHREKIGDMPTEMFLHFFKSLSDNAKMNLNIKAEGQNEHHKIEGIYKAFARALRMAVTMDTEHLKLPSSKGVL